MKQNILKLTTAAFVGLFATSAHATWTLEEYEALLGAKPTLLKKLADEINDAGGSDAFEQILGAGGPDVVKNRIGAGGNTGADVDLDAQIARIEGGNPTLKVAIDDTKALINSGVAANTLLQDIQAEADRANGGVHAADLHTGITTALGNPGAIGNATFAKVNGATNAATLDAQLDIELARISNPAPASIDAGLTAIENLIPHNANIVADIGAEIAVANAASGVGPAPATLHGAVAGLVGVVPAAGTLQKVTGVTTLATLNANLDTLRARIDATPAASIDAGLTAVEVLVPHNVSLVADIGVVKGTIDGAGATVANAVTNAAGKIGAGATIPLAIADAKTAVGVGGNATIAADVRGERDAIEAGQPDLVTAVNHAKTAVGTGGNTSIVADLGTEKGRIGAGADLHAAISTQIARLNVPAPADITTGLAAAEALIINPYANTLVQNLATFRTNLIAKLNAEGPNGANHLTFDGTLNVAANDITNNAANTLSVLLTFIGTKQITD